MKKAQNAPQCAQSDLKTDPDVEIKLAELIQQVRSASSEDHNLRLPQMKVKTGLASATIWARVKTGMLPPPYHTYHVGNKVSRSVAWSNLEVTAVQAANRYASRSGKKIDIRAFVARLIAENLSVAPINSAKTHIQTSHNGENHENKTA